MMYYGNVDGDWQHCQYCQGVSQVGTLKNFGYGVANSREFPCGNRD